MGDVNNPTHNPGGCEHGAGGEDRVPAALQTVGYKGVAWLLTERGVAVAGKNLDELVPVLVAMGDFKAEMSAVQHILKEAGHLAFFNAVCHPELAYIEMVWTEMKRLLRPNVDDTDATLLREMKAGKRLSRGPGARV